MALIGYARVSIQEQHFDLQLNALHDAGCDGIFEDEGYSAVNPNRPGYEDAIKALKGGDIFIAWKPVAVAASTSSQLQVTLPNCIVVTGITAR